MDNILPDFTSFEADEYEAISTHWEPQRSIPPPSTPPRLRFLLPPKAPVVESHVPYIPPQLPLPAPNERYIAPVYSATQPSPLSVAERGQCEEFALVLEQSAPLVARSQKETARSDGKRESKLSVWNMLAEAFTLFVQRKTVPASWEIAPAASQSVLLLGDHHTKLDSAPVGLTCCVGTVVNTVRPSLPDVTTVQVPFLPEQLGLHVQFLEAEQAVIVTGVLEDSQASDFERYVLGARILAVNDFAVSNLEDFGQKIMYAINSEQDMVISFLPRFVSVPGIDKFNSQAEDGSRRTSYRRRQISKRLGSFSSQQQECTTPQPSPSRQGSSNMGSDSWMAEEDYASLLASKISPSRNAPPAGWEFATGGGMEAVDEADPEEPLKVFTDTVQRYLQGVPEHLYHSTRSQTSCIMVFSNFSMQHVLEVYWCDYDGLLQRKATLVSGQSYRSEGTTGQVWLLMAIPRVVQTVAEYQRSLQAQSRKPSKSASSGDVLLVQAHKSLISTLTGYTGMWAPTANNLSFVRRGRSTSSARSGQNADSAKADAPHLTVHLVCPKAERASETQQR